MKLNLTFASEVYDLTVSLQNGSVSPEGIDLNFLRMGAFELFQRQGRHAEFDVSEMSLNTYTTLYGQGDRRLIAIPVFPYREFRHSDIYINTNAGIREPKDLVGKRVGAQEYQMTANIWIRGHLQHECGVRPDQMEWYFGGWDEPQDYTERVPITLPSNLRTQTISNQQCLDQMLERGEVDALIGATEPLSLRRGSPNVGRLFPNYHEVETDYYRRTGIFPIMHTVVIKREIYEKAPWVAVSLYKACALAKEEALGRLPDTASALFCMIPWIGAHFAEVKALMGRDAFPYGLEENRKVLETFLQYSHEQGFINQPLKLEELFAPETHGRVDLRGI